MWKIGRNVGDPCNSWPDILDEESDCLVEPIGIEPTTS